MATFKITRPPTPATLSPRVAAIVRELVGISQSRQESAKQ
jgi:hypothetical protein